MCIIQSFLDINHFFLQNKRNWAKIWLIFGLAEFIRILEQETELSLTNRATRIVQMQ